jgi:hypothetical protein
MRLPGSVDDTEATLADDLEIVEPVDVHVDAGRSGIAFDHHVSFTNEVTVDIGRM